MPPKPTENTRHEHQEEKETNKPTHRPTRNQTTPQETTPSEKQLTKRLEKHLAENPPSLEEADKIEDILTKAGKDTTQKETPEPTPSETTEPPETQRQQKEQIEQHLAKHTPTEEEADQITDILNKAADTTQEQSYPRLETHQQSLGPEETPKAAEPTHTPKPEEPITIKTKQDLDQLVERHPYFRDRKDFQDQYQRAQDYLTVKEAQQQLQPDLSQEKVSQALGISRDAYRNWFVKEQQPHLINNLTIHEKALRAYEAQLPPETHKHRTNPTVTYHSLKPFHDNPKLQTPENLAHAIREIYKSHTNPPQIIYAELRPYFQAGPQWQKEIATKIHKHSQQIELHFNQQTTRDQPHHFLRVTADTTTHTLYIWRQNTHPDNWLNTYAKEQFYFHTTKTKNQLATQAQQHLNTTGLGLSRLIRQLTKHPGQPKLPTSPLSDLEPHHSYLRGSSLKIILDTTGKTIQDIQPHIKRIGSDFTGTGKSGIHNPRFPTGQQLDEFRARAYSLIASDGHIHNPSRILTYCDSSPERIQYVKQLFKNALGDIHINNDPRSGGRTRIIMAVPVGRLLETWGMPVGDKILQPTTLPPTIRHGTPKTRRAYLEELIPEDGGFYTHKTSGRFQWKRGTILNAGPKAVQYGFTPKTTPQQEELIKQHGKIHTINVRDDQPRTAYSIRYNPLKRLAKEAENPQTRQTAQQLQNIIKQNIPPLMADEIELCETLEIKITSIPQAIRLHETGRVSAIWLAKTTGQPDAHKWAILAPPTTGPKRTAAQEWLQTRKNTQQLKQQLRKQGQLE